jgi:hypothetical protein
MKACRRCLLCFILGLRAVNLHEIVVRRVRPSEEPLYQEQMQKHHYLGSQPKIGEYSHDLAYGITSRKPQEANPQQLLAINRAHWSIENSCHYILDWNFDEDRSRIRTGYGPENISRLRRFAIGVIKSKSVRSVAQKMRKLTG